MCIDQAVAESLSLVSHSKMEVHGVNGMTMASKYIANLTLPVVDGAGRSFAFRFPVDCTGVPDLAKRYARDSINLVGILGRNFLQFCSVTIDGTTGRTSVQIDEAIMRPRP
ncbi:hypothetical protein SAMN05216569_3119 [Pseudoxanthomonas sp. CF125]|nr:hypothetical protein SAMN05216569_3119 [Pseudoxanthomonas sp. CF125]